MKQLVVIASLIVSSFSLYAQETKEKVMEGRAREMHRMICSDNRDQWRNFIKQNYSQTLIDKPMRMVVEESGGSGSSSTRPADNLEGKVSMYERLHEDFGTSKIVSLKPAGEKLDMVLATEDGLTGTFTLTFTADKPYLIDGLGVQAGDGGR